MKKLIAIAMLILSAQINVAQPIIGLGHSKCFIASHMKGSPGWSLVKESKSELTYSDGDTIFTYSFLKDSPGISGRTCTQCKAVFKDSTSLCEYIYKKVENWKFKPCPDMLNMIVMTDLFNDTIMAVVVGDKTIVFNY